jgi:uncharacterized membrane protein
VRTCDADVCSGAPRRFPANINKAINGLPLGDRNIPAWALWARLPLQLVLIAWAYWYTRDDADA